MKKTGFRASAGYGWFLAVLVIASLLAISCGSAFAEQTVYGIKTDEEILFNNLEWGTSREQVFSFLQEKFSDVELVERCKEYEYGSMKRVVCTYSNKSYGSLGIVGEMEVDEITVWYICEDNRYDYSMYAAQYESEDYSSFKAMAEMLEYKYGTPYSYYDENSSSMGSTFDMDIFTWMNQNETQKLTITRNNNVLDFGALFGSSSKTYDKNMQIYYCDTVVSDYLSAHVQVFEEQERETEMANKNYDGL